MPKATIHSRTGALITIEGSKEEVGKILSDFERFSMVHHEKNRMVKNVAKKRQEKKRRAASELIRELRDSNFFTKPKTLGEIAEALESKGYLYRTTSLSGVVLDLVKHGELGRKKVEGQWVYGK